MCGVYNATEKCVSFPQMGNLFENYGRRKYVFIASMRKESVWSANKFEDKQSNSHGANLWGGTLMYNTCRRVHRHVCVSAVFLRCFVISHSFYYCAGASTAAE